jgi:hypothetical protein
MIELQASYIGISRVLPLELQVQGVAISTTSRVDSVDCRRFDMSQTPSKLVLCNDRLYANPRVEVYGLSSRMRLRGTAVDKTSSNNRG